MTQQKPPPATNAQIQLSLTFSGLRVAVEADTELSQARSRDIISAINRFCDLAGLDPHATPASVASVRCHGAGLHPQTAGVSAKTLQNMRSALLFAVRRYTSSEPRRGKACLSPKWQVLWERLPAGELRYGLSRLLRFCSERDITPDEVSDAILDTFLRWLQEETLVKRPGELHRRNVVMWNKACEAVSDWPTQRLTVPAGREAYCLKWCDFPANLRLDAEAWLAAGENPDPFGFDGFRRPLRPKTLEGRRFQIRQLVSALHRRGHDIARLQSLADLVTVDNVEEALRFHYERGGNQPSKTTADLAAIVVVIARHWCSVAEDHLDRLLSLKRNLSPPAQKGLSEKNRTRLRQFTDPRNVEALLSLPQRIYVTVRRHQTPTLQDARDMQVAVALELLLMMPIRRANLVALLLGPDGHLKLHRDRKGTTYIVIPGHEVKNDEPLEYPIPAETGDLLEAYTTGYRPMLDQHGTMWLFPGEKAGAHKSFDQFSRQFSATVRRWTGLTINLHLMRHFGAMLYLEENPGNYEVIRRVLGHRRMETTVNSYVGMEMSATVRHFDAVILGLRSGISREVSDG